MKTLQQEQGQSIVLIAFGLAVLMAFMALAVDGGNVYAQRRQVQNAVDAASSAAGERLARHDPSSNARATNGQVYDLVKEYLKKNGVRMDGANANAHNLSVRYVTRDTADTDHVDSVQITSYGTGSAAPLRIPTGTGDPVVGVSVQVDKDFKSFFAGIVGITTMQVGANSPGYGAPIINCAPPCSGNPAPETTGSCCSDDVFPIALNQDMFQDLDGDGNLDITFEEASSSTDFVIWQRATTAPNFVFTRWDGDSNNSTTLTNNMNDVSRSGTQYVQEWVGTSAATLSNVSSTMNTIKNLNKPVTVIVYDSSRSGNTEYRIVGFARLQLTAVCPTGNGSGSCALTGATQPFIRGKFEQWTSSRCEGSCAFFGVRTNKPAPPVEQERALIGVVKLNQHFLENISFAQTPVDVVHVLDISGSMDYCIGTTNDCADNNTNQKLNMAKKSLITFNGIMSPTLGDRAGLATFPRTQGTSSYSMPCGGSYSTYMFGENRMNMTNNLGASTSPYSPSSSLNYLINSLSANSGTPIAGGLLVGRGMATGGYHTAGHQPVIVLASDGIANVRTNGKWTGFTGSTYSAPTCNTDAVQDAVAEANLAKQDANGDGRPDVIIFSVAIGTDFNSDALEAIASEPSESHYFTVSSASAMQSIYNQIATVLQTGDCTASDQEKFASGAVIQVRNTTTGQNYTATASTTGYFEIRNIDPGTYEFLSATVTFDGLTYDMFTDGVGGPILGSHPTIEVGDAPTTYDVNLALETDDFRGFMSIVCKY